jgi:hypothetical protein
MFFNCQPCCGDGCPDYSVFEQAETLHATVSYDYTDTAGSELYQDSDPPVFTSGQEYSNDFSGTFTLAKSAVTDWSVTWTSAPIVANGREMTLVCDVNKVPRNGSAPAGSPPNTFFLRQSLAFRCVRGIHPDTPAGPGGGPALNRAGLGHIGMIEKPCVLTTAQAANPAIPPDFALAGGLFRLEGILPNWFTGVTSADVFSFGHNRDGSNIFSASARTQFRNLAVNNFEIPDAFNTFNILSNTCRIDGIDFGSTGSIGEVPLNSSTTTAQGNLNRLITFTDTEGQFGPPGEVYSSASSFFSFERLTLSGLLAVFDGFTQNMLMDSGTNAYWNHTVFTQDGFLGAFRTDVFGPTSAGIRRTWDVNSSPCAGQIGTLV